MVEGSLLNIYEIPMCCTLVAGARSCSLKLENIGFEEGLIDGEGRLCLKAKIYKYTKLRRIANMGLYTGKVIHSVDMW